MKLKLLLSLLPLAFSVFGQIPSPENYQIHIRRTASPVKPDGELDEPIWQTAQKVGDFQLQFPVDTGFSKWPTEVQLAFDDRYIYLAATCFQKREDYTAQSLKRDYTPGTADAFNFLLDPSKDGLNGFLFASTSLGVQREALLANGTTQSPEWDNKWRSEVKNHDDRWVLEMAIPFKTLRYTVSSGPNTWRINFLRAVVKNWEVSCWFPVPRQYLSNNLAFCGTLIWDEPPPKPSRNISLIPFATAGYSTNYIRNDTSLALLERPGKFSKSIGGDAKIAITPSLNLDLTLNPDFSQVEVDQQVANLQRFELFFPERRQFFLENRDLFAMFGFPSTRPFFSRRIGLARDSISGGFQTVPIVAGARLSGKINDNWRVGFLNMQTKRKQWGEGSALPAANFTVATFQRKTFARSTLAGIFVNKENFLGSLDSIELGKWKPWNRVAGLEYNLYSADNRWEGEWYAHRSFSPDKEREGYTFAHFLGYTVRRWNARLGYNFVGGNYDSESGYVPRPGVQGFFPGATLNFYPAHSRVNVFSISASGNLTYNLDWKSTDREFDFVAQADFKNQASANAGFYSDFVWLFDPFDPTRTGNGEQLPANAGYAYSGFQANYTSSTSYDLQGAAKLGVGQFYNGNGLVLEGSISYRLQPIGLFSMTYSYNRIRLPEPYSSADVLLLGPRAELTFSRSLFLSAFFQYNTQANNFNTNARLQWRFAPVSDVFLVYTDNAFVEKIRGTEVRFLSPKNKAVVLKVVYWLNV